MFQRFSTNTLSLLLLIGVALLFIELFFFNSGLVFTLIFFSFLIFIGRKQYESTFGKILFGFGCIVLFFTVLNMFAFRFLAIALVILFFIHYQKSKEEPEYLSPQFGDENINALPEPIVKVEPLFQNKFFGNQQTSESPYQWRDINIHGGVGDRVIDLSNTVLPEDAVISIRHIVGNIKIYVPYEVEVHVHHSSLLGRATIFHKRHTKLFNESISYYTEGYGVNTPRVKIVTSVVSGDIEVKRI
ncbi:cell wall-active antibiotics response protein LiaF [Evansella cellulosilytica]|uniref:Cell wall-active antibiotics response LiaF-like C-terminal domain-containing protein n=1 Tax=Evansella cellulosilytica (strain ATCC 21833 / DSM 2522 / FERM P-1141 / JCM 9156 / N-4) TaxID=649639 RepID=E6TZQ0_EVAC2|nr:cell wall-active antibiotics response protein LiaF [Evansella cellulosilytica]ADU31356.1 hypothetical protein Bcell_3113 [Evansella cellulosilytica DSM 2522]